MDNEIMYDSFELLYVYIKKIDRCFEDTYFSCIAGGMGICFVRFGADDIVRPALPGEVQYARAGEKCGCSQ